MKNTIRLASLALLFSVLSIAQMNTVSTTTASAAIAVTDQIISVASATGITADPETILFVGGEALRVQSVSSTSITVRRAAEGTRRLAHASGSTIWIGRPNWFYAHDPAGSCTVGALFSHPAVNLRSGKVFDCVSSVWREIRRGGDGANMLWEGATENAYQTTLAITEPTADRTVTIPNATQTVGERQVTYMQGPTVANAVNTIFFIADRAYTVTAVKAVWGTAESTGAMAVIPEKLTGTTACGSGDDLLSAAIDAATTANTVATGALHGTAANLALAAGDRICVTLTATPNEIKDLTVTITLLPL